VDENVTVVIPTYNGSAFLREALLSVYAQRLAPREVVIVDDASRDDTVQLVQSWAKESPIPLRLIPMQRNSGGPALPLNVGIAAATGELIAVLEHDDVMHPERLELQVQALNDNPRCGMAAGRRGIMTQGDGGTTVLEDRDPPFTDIASFRQSTNGTVVLERKTFFRNMLGGNFIYSNSNLTFRKTLWQRIGGYRRRWRTNCDADFILRSACIVPLAIINRITFGYRLHDDSLYHSSLSTARTDGRLLRLAVSANRLDWAEDEIWSVYWQLRADADMAIRQQRYALACRIWCNLFRSGLVARHCVYKLGIAPHPCRHDVDALAAQVPSPGCAT
jgi:glycosyltransferase involved in cell wall biosynthesis